jgi:hypothetical protein
MAALSDWFSPSSWRRGNPRPKPVKSPLEFARDVYRETNGATPELRKLMLEYREKKRNGTVVVRGYRSKPDKR